MESKKINLILASSSKRRLQMLKSIGYEPHKVFNPKIEEKVHDEETPQKYVTRLAEELVQIQSELIFSRTAFEIGIGNWKNTSILKDKIKLNTNLFLFRE